MSVMYVCARAHALYVIVYVCWRKKERPNAAT